MISLYFNIRGQKLLNETEEKQDLFLQKVADTAIGYLTLSTDSLEEYFKRLAQNCPNKLYLFYDKINPDNGMLSQEATVGPMIVKYQSPYTEVSLLEEILSEKNLKYQRFPL